MVIVGLIQLFFINSTPLSTVYAQELLPGTIKGIVSDRSTGRVISNASIDLFQNDVSVSGTTTEDDGAYFFSIPSGSYDLVVSKRGFKQSSVTITIAASETLTENISLSPIQTDNNVDQTVKSSGAQTGSSKTTTTVFGFINGTIVEAATGLAISNAIVALNKAGEEIVSGITPDNGVYFLEALPGEYTLSAQKQGFNTKLVDVSISAFDRTELEVPLVVEGAAEDDTPTPPPVTTPTLVPGESPIPTETPVPVVTPSPTATPDLFIELCEGGGNPGFMRVEPSVIMMQANTEASIKIVLLNDDFTDSLKSINDSDNRQRRRHIKRKIKRKRARACIADIKVECVKRSCKRLKLFRDTITTNKQGAAYMTIRTRDVKHERIAKLKFTAGDVVETVTVIILPNE